MEFIIVGISNSLLSDEIAVECNERIIWSTKLDVSYHNFRLFIIPAINNLPNPDMWDDIAFNCFIMFRLFFKSIKWIKKYLNYIYPLYIQKYVFTENCDNFLLRFLTFVYNSTFYESDKLISQRSE